MSECRNGKCIFAGVRSVINLRPAWEKKTGMEQISIDLGLSRRVYKEKDEFIQNCSKESKRFFDVIKPYKRNLKGYQNKRKLFIQEAELKLRNVEVQLFI